MKKLKLSLSNMKGAELLTREQLKNVMGGSGGTGGGGGVCNWGPCTLSIQDSSGNWKTSSGSCTYGMMWNSPGTCYCETGSGIIPVYTNNSTSRCNP